MPKTSLISNLGNKIINKLNPSQINNNQKESVSQNSSNTVGFVSRDPVPPTSIRSDNLNTKDQDPNLNDKSEQGTTINQIL